MTLTYLSDALAREDARDQAHRLLQASRDALGFDFRSLFELDVHTLHTSFKQTHTHAPGENLQQLTHRTLLPQLQVAVDQYRGNFLE